MQHFNLPIQSVAIRSKMIDIPLKIGAFTVEPEFEKSELLKFKKWSAVRPEIEKMGNSIACKPIVDNFHTAINTLHSGLRKIFSPKYDEVKNRLENILNETKLHLNNQNDESTEFAAYITEFKEDSTRNNIWVPDEILKRIDKLVLKNKLSVNLNYSFSTMQSFD
jgi:transposase